MNNLQPSSGAPVDQRSMERSLLWLRSIQLLSIITALTLSATISRFIDYYLFHQIILGIIAFNLMLLYFAAKADPKSSIVFVFSFGFSMFHFGIIPIFLLSSGSIDTLGFNLFLWYYDTEYMIPAYLIAVNFLVGLVASLLLPLLRLKERFVFIDDQQKLEGLSKIALIVLVASIAIWFVIVFIAGFGSYDILVAGLISTGRGAIIGMIHTAIGTSFILSVITTKSLKLPLGVFGLWAFFAFSIGLRGEAAFPALIVIGILSCQERIKLNFWRIASVSILFLIVSSAVSVLRMSASQDTFLGAASAAKGIAELGGSIRPAYEVIRWVETGDAFQYGTTYFAPFERLFLRFFPLIDRIPAYLDMRLMNIAISERAGPYGFSIAAEAYYNFGYMGTFVVGTITGYLARITGAGVTRRKLSLGMLAVTFGAFFHIRQAFVSAFGAFFISLILLTLIWITWNLFFKRRWR